MPPLPPPPSSSCRRDASGPSPQPMYSSSCSVFDAVAEFCAACYVRSLPHLIVAPTRYCVHVSGWTTRHHRTYLGANAVAENDMCATSGALYSYVLFCALALAIIQPFTTAPSIAVPAARSELAKDTREDEHGGQSCSSLLPLLALLLIAFSLQSRHPQILLTPPSCSHRCAHQNPAHAAPAATIRILSTKSASTSWRIAIARMCPIAGDDGSKAAVQGTEKAIKIGSNASRISCPTYKAGRAASSTQILLDGYPVRYKRPRPQSRHERRRPGAVLHSYIRAGFSSRSRRSSTCHSDGSGGGGEGMTEHMDPTTLVVLFVYRISVARHQSSIVICIFEVGKAPRTPVEPLASGVRRRARQFAGMRAAAAAESTKDVDAKARKSAAVL
ncbi:hypothetical protein C8R45DRAFT_1100516 [Mycena sanguinolenta]|nr:hypothetical protein C8R45DRAFT_1100516 [Mycena sanguinolenta]